ncbi:putative Heterokaryon incompatibility protein 6, OR allele [Glarea lozoyensis 74030]|uniref:Putative Heterokaryon incompatibility protein 6, OR allele n=1 Tax=Glarea lozoyensis (strain ATCC 74030 / MF5533) TaxID=1104152 RepID=H0ESE7_GLAL7|nr:putative Heterokaryon incompatibility protein 6, OR allele [Glarea lozoyensis 74030]
MVRVGEEHFLDAVRLLKNNIEKIKSNRIRLGLQQLWKKVTQIDKPRMKAIRSKFGSEIIGKSLGRLPFVTGKGHLVLGPEYVKRGDFVALIKGTQVPFILRRQSDGQYQLVSEAYVDGIMDGEAIKNARWSHAKDD